MGGIVYKIERNKSRQQISTKFILPGNDTQPVYFLGLVKTSLWQNHNNHPSMIVNYIDAIQTGRFKKMISAVTKNFAEKLVLSLTMIMMTCTCVNKDYYYYHY